MPRKIFIIGAVVISIVIFVSGYRTAAHFARVREMELRQELQPSAQSVLLSLKGQGFLITQTYLFNQSVAIDHTSGSFLKDLFWNQAITASANVKVSSGVDLSQLTSADIQQNGNQLTVSLPVPTRYSTEVLGAVSVQNKQGVLKKIFDSDDGYNQALSVLKTETEKAVLTPELLEDAQSTTKEEIGRLIHVLMPASEVHIVFK